MKTYKIKPTSKQLKQIKFYWDRLVQAEGLFYARITDLEQSLEKETKIKGIEFFNCEGEYVGVGNWQRTMKLIQLR